MPGGGGGLEGGGSIWVDNSVRVRVLLSVMSANVLAKTKRVGGKPGSTAYRWVPSCAVNHRPCHRESAH